MVLKYYQQVLEQLQATVTMKQKWKQLIKVLIYKIVYLWNMNTKIPMNTRALNAQQNAKI